MQSGISASQELLTEFGKLLADDSLFGLLVTIADESLRPVRTLPSSSGSGSGSAGDFGADLAQLAPHLRPDEAMYVILRRRGGGGGGGATSAPAPSLVLVSYVPDRAGVRQKTLFASTRLTLARELGSEHIGETIFATTAEELSADGFARHDRHAALAAPLTEQERTLDEVKRAEAEAGAGGTSVREIHLSKTMTMPIATDALVALGELGRGQGRGLVMLKINPQNEIVEVVESSESPTSTTELVSSISRSEPRFTFWRYSHTHDGVDSSPVLFFYTCPAAAGKSIKFRMMYPLMKRSVIGVAEGECGIKIEQKFEVEEPDEITEESVTAELHPRAEVKTAFKRPKRPGR